jgi:hypothetical protein
LCFQGQKHLCTVRGWWERPGKEQMIT